MIFSQGLIISLGFTFEIAVALFFYVRQRTNAVEDKINTLIQFVQTETLKLQQPRGHEEMSVYQVQPTVGTQNDNNLDLIDVSDDESSSSDSELSSDDNDSSDDDDDESTLGSINSVKEQEQTETTRTVSMQPTEEDGQNNEDVIHLRFIKPEEEKDTPLVTGDEHISNNLEEELDALTLSDLSDGEDQVVDDECEDEEQVDESGSPIVNYKKMLVSQLRMIAEQKGLVEDGRKFKKSELIALLGKQ